MESDSGCRNQASLRRNTSCRKQPTRHYCACAVTDIVPLSSILVNYCVFCVVFQAEKAFKKAVKLVEKIQKKVL